MKFWATARARLLAGAVVVVGSALIASATTQHAEAAPRTDAWNNAQWAACIAGNSREGAVYRDVRRASRSSVSTAAIPSVTRDRADLDNVNSDGPTRATALADCNDARRRNSSYNVQGYLCAGEANLKPPQSGFAPDAGQAYCNFHAAALLAFQAHDGNLQSQAHIGRAKALEADGGAQADIAAAYQEAIAANSAATEARVELAKYYVRINELSQAEDLLVVRNQQGGISGAFPGADQAANTAIALGIVDLAGSDETNRMALLSAAQGAASHSIAVNSALGDAYFAKPDQWSMASQFLQTATEGTVEPGYEALQEKAFLDRSVLYTNRGDLAQAKTFSGRAGSTPAAVRQACLVRLLIGGDEIYVVDRDANGRTVRVHSPQSTEAFGWCSRLGSSGEGRLLVGMYWLRYAQLTPPTRTAAQREAWRANVGQAVQAFRDGQNNTNDHTTTLTWPLPTQAPDITLYEALAYGYDLARFAESGCQGTPATDTEHHASVLFDTYQVSRCGGPSGN